MSHHHRHKHKGASPMRVHWEVVETVGSLAPSGREGHSADLINNSSVYTFGGLENGERVSKLLSFDLKTHRWLAQSDRSSIQMKERGEESSNTIDGEDMPELVTTETPLPRCYHDSWVVGHRLLCFGGEGSSSNADKETKEGFHNSSVFDDPATHRRTRRVCFDDVSLYDTLSHTWEVVKSGLAPLPRKGHTCTMVGKGTDAQVIVFGGEPSGKGAPMNDTHCVSVKSLLEGVAMWEKQRPLGDTPSPRHGHTAVAMVDIPHHNKHHHNSGKKDDGSGSNDGDQPYLVVFGGTGGGALLFNDVYTFGLVTKEWEMVQCDGVCPSPRYGHTASLVPKRHPVNGVYVGTGGNGTGGNGTGGNGTGGGGEKKQYYMGNFHPIMIVFGGVTRNGSELSFLRDMQILNMRTKTWSEVRTTHLYPSPRYGHSMVLLEAPFQAQEKTNDPYTSSNHVHVCKLLIFGGLNSRYCSNEIWSAEIQMMKSGRETWGDGFDDGIIGGMGSSNESPSKKRSTKRSVSGQEFEEVNRELMKERKLKILAEERLIAERKLKQQALEEINRLKSRVEQIEKDMMRTRREAELKVERVVQSGENDRRQLDVLRGELDEKGRLLGLMDLRGQIRVKQWQKRAADAEEKLEKLRSQLEREPYK
jgi:hypothetical protein